MEFTKNDFDKVNDRLKQIIDQEVEKITVSNDQPPTVDELKDSNIAYVLDSTILFIDIRKSTYLTENTQVKNMIKIYRSFMRMAVSCVRASGGYTRQFSGDRIMGVFLDSLNDKKEITESSINKAINCARSMQTCIDYSLNKLLKNKINIEVTCGIGIDCGKVLLTKVGMYGLEKDESKENETDCVWVGKCTNRASKFADLAEGGQIFISEEVYKKLPNKVKNNNIWQNISKYKSGMLFNGYVANRFYLEFSRELGEITITNDEFSNEEAKNIAEAIKELDKIQQRLNQKEIELKILEEKLKQEKAINNNDIKKIEQENKRLELKRKLFISEKKDFYSFLKQYIDYSHCKTEYINKMGLEFWQQLITEIFILGKDLEKNDKQIKIELAPQLIYLYNHFSIYNEAYNIMIIMAEENGDWVSIWKNTILWAKQNNIIYKLINEIEKRMNDKNKNTNLEGYISALKEIKNIIGY